MEKRWHADRHRHGRLSVPNFAEGDKQAPPITIALENARLFIKTREPAYRDALTRLFNRRYFEEALDREARRTIRYNLPVALLMSDIDHFKIHDDSQGHRQGDNVLKEVTACLTENTQVDVTARIGGEEFVVILPMTTKSHGRMVSEKLRGSVEETTISGEQSCREAG